MSLVTSRGLMDAEPYMLGYERAYKTGRGVVWCHASGDDELEAWGLDTGGATSVTRTVAQVFTDAGMVVIDPYLGGTKSWGNDTAQTRITDARTLLQGSFGAKAGKIILAAISMSGIAALNWARANPTLVEAIVLFYPAVNLVACHDATGGASSFATAIEAAYGGSAAYTTAAPTHDPAQHASSYTGVPIRMYYSTADTVVGTANQTAFAAAVGGSAFGSVSLGASAHPDMSVIPTDDLATFAAAHG